MRLKLFTASWCGPCQMLKDRLAKENLHVECVDVSTDFSACREYSVRNIPALVVENGDSVETIKGIEEIFKIIKENQ